MHLFFRLFEKELCLSDHLLALFQSLFNLIGLLQNANVVAIGELLLLLPEELCADIGFLVKLLGLELHVDEVGIFQQARKLVKLLLLKKFELLMERIEKIYDALAKLILQVELFALGDLLTTLDQIVCPFINILEEVLSGSLEQQDLVVVVPVMGKVAALLTDKLVMQAAVSHVAAAMVRAEGLLLGARILLVRLLLFVVTLCPIVIVEQLAGVLLLLAAHIVISHGM